MNKLFKAGALILLLAVPVLVYIFLKCFGENHYGLRTFFPIDVEKHIVDGKEVNDTIFHTVPDFKFKDQYGNEVTQKQLDGGVYVADFFFTTCGSICPKMSNQLERVQDMFKDNQHVKIISHTVDPETDSVSVLAAYAKLHNATKDKWYFVTGDKQSLYDLGQKGYFISTLQDTTLPIEDQFIHSEKLILVDKEKHIRGYYNGTDPKEVDKLLLEIKILLHEYEIAKK